jgi:hypothetical protein
MDYTKIITKLIGSIEPVGETNTDNERFENLKAQCKLVEELVMRIQYVANSNKDRHENSMKRASDYADLFLTKTLGIH